MSKPLKVFYSDMAYVIRLLLPIFLLGSVLISVTLLLGYIGILDYNPKGFVIVMAAWWTIVLMVVVCFFYCSRQYPVRLYPNGIGGYNCKREYHFVKWEDIHKLYTTNINGFDCILLVMKGFKKQVLLPNYLKGMGDFARLVQEYDTEQSFYKYWKALEAEHKK